MKGDAKVVAGLNEYLSYELTGHRQYLIHAAMCRHWRFERLAEVQDAYSAEETRHAARIIARILVLDGVAAPRELGTIAGAPTVPRSEEHTSELQSPLNLVCRLLLEKKK